MQTLKTKSRVSPAVQKLIAAAKAAGVPADALRRFLTAGYVPQPKQLQFHAAACGANAADAADDIGFGGARGGGKTHTTFAQVALNDCQEWPGLKVLFLRKVSKAANEAIQDLRASVLKRTPHTFKEHKSTIIFPNGSRIIIGHFNSERDIDNYLGLEYDVIVVEEATQLSNSKIEKIKTCNRSSKPNFRPRRYYTTNPGGIGHAWFKKQFIEPFRRHKESNTKFIPSLVTDNTAVNKEYVKQLQSLTGWLRAAWLEGDWDIFAGQFFTNFSYNLHTVEPSAIPNPLPDNWRIWASLDYGFTHYTVSYLFAEGDGHIYCVDEHYGRKKGVEWHAEQIKQMLARHGVSMDDLSNFVGGTDMFAQRGAATGQTIADQYADHGINLRRANTDRIAGAGRILALLGDADEGITPGLTISRRCRLLLEQLPVIQHDPNRPEDVLKTNMDEAGEGGDDAYDSFRYGIMTNGSIGIVL